MSFLHTGWLGKRSLRDRVRSSVTREELGVEPLLLHIERSQLRWLGHLFRMPPGRLPREVFQACPTGRRPRGRPRTRWRDYVSQLAWERLGVPPGESWRKCLGHVPPGGGPREDPRWRDYMSLSWPGNASGVPPEELEEVSGSEGSLGISAQTAASTTRYKGHTLHNTEIDPEVMMRALRRKMMDPDYIPPTCNLDAPSPSDESSSAKRRCMLPAVEVLTLMKTTVTQTKKSKTSQNPLRDPTKKRRRAASSATWKKADLDNLALSEYQHSPSDFVQTPLHYFCTYFSPQLPSVDNYWKMETRVLQVANLMSSKRFRLLKRLVHFNDNTNIPGTNHRFLIWPLFSFLNTAFRRKDYTGGPWCPLTPEQEAMGATSQIVSILANTMSSSTTTAIFADNFFSSLEIVRYLKEKNCRLKPEEDRELVECRSEQHNAPIICEITLLAVITNNMFVYTSLMVWRQSVSVTLFQDVIVHSSSDSPKDRAVTTPSSDVSGSWTPPGLHCSKVRSEATGGQQRGDFQEELSSSLNSSVKLESISTIICILMLLKAQILALNGFSDFSDTSPLTSGAESCCSADEAPAPRPALAPAGSSEKTEPRHHLRWETAVDKRLSHSGLQRQLQSQNRVSHRGVDTALAVLRSSSALIVTQTSAQQVS
ncbi:hypothetical protein L3Q82_005084 [Scortum barcoo]|uniref:Uncharacterized protein n=1 Tax=Scortum barcoo TaxID=214431 RepID=A0ACB8VDW7_9TELE|nr:hypothetical protein L3Q82_005084 [Scortum barcoo]